MAEIGTQQSVAVKVEPAEDYEPMNFVSKGSIEKGSDPVRVKIEEGQGDWLGPGGEFWESLGFEQDVNVESGAEVRVEGDEFGDERRPEAAHVESVAVINSKLYAVPRRSSKGNKGYIFRKSARLKHGVDRDTASLKTYHRSKLRYLLNNLIQQQKWHQACGVISVLLGISNSNPKSPHTERCWSDFAAAIEVIQRIGNTGNVGPNDLRIRRLFRLLNRFQPNMKSRGKLQLELALYLMSVGDREAAYDELRPVVDGKIYREDPVLNYCYGLNAYHLWYEKSVEEISSWAISEYDSQIKVPNPLEGIGENYGPEAGGKVDLEVAWLLLEDGSGAKKTEPEMNIWQSSQRSIYEETDEEGFVKTGEEFWQTVIVPNSRGLDRRLFPIQIPQAFDQKKYLVPMKDGRIRDLHAAAVKHLTQALTSAPDMVPALLPLVQLHLALHDIRGAVDEIDKCSKALQRHFVPPSIKVALLESLDQKDPAQLATCHEDVLIRNPLSLSSLNTLINLHTSGNLETMVLVRCICLHLDVDLGSVDIWQRLASCLLELQQRLSQHPLETSRIISGQGQTDELASEALQTVSRGDLRRLWSGRRKWWLQKHFSNKCGQEQKQDGDIWLLAYRVACAAHIYGPRALFVEQGCKALEEQGDYDILQNIKLHCARSLNLFGEG